MSTKFLKLKQVSEKTTLSPPTIWRKEKKGEFPARRQISANRVGWLESEIDDWLSRRVNGCVAPEKKG
jgi:prophage regulatory protein